MHPNTEKAYDFFLSLKKRPGFLERVLNPGDDFNLQFLNEMALNLFSLTSFEIQDSPIEFQNFIKKNNFLKDSTINNGITGPYQEFEYNIKRLKSHLKYSEVAYEYFEYVAESNFDDIEEALGYEKDEIDWDQFKHELDHSRKEILYDQALVNLISLFEYYVSNLLRWIYRNDSSTQDNLRVSLTYEDIRLNMDNLLDFILNQYLNYLNWPARKKKLNSNLKFNWKEELPGSDIIDEAIERRNLIVHNKGRINKSYLKKYPSSGKLNDVLKTNSKYYYNVQTTTENVVKIIDQKVIDKVKNS